MTTTELVGTDTRTAAVGWTPWAAWAAWAAWGWETTSTSEAPAGTGRESAGRA
jgi:hypothetical protein